MSIPWMGMTLLFVMMLGPSARAGQEGREGKDIVGRVEHVRIYPGDLLLRAKLDTGANICSLHAPRMSKFSEGDTTWVRFTAKNHRGEETTIVKKVLREAKMKKEGQVVERRPVILLGICMGRQYREVEVNLVDRTGFNYALLIGRNFLMGHMIVDPELKYTMEPACVGAPMP
jgi:hypothetical protein